MRYLLISDIHANLPAFEAVLTDAKGLYDKIWCLGDLVSVGPYPNECVELLLTLDHLCVAGDEDWIVLGKADLDKSYLADLKQHNPNLRLSFLQTREQLTNKTRNYLEELPITLAEGDFTLVHGSPRHPLWEYVHFPKVAQANFEHFKTNYCFVGHYHAPLVFEEATEPDTMCQVFAPNPDTNKSGEVVKLGSQRLIINPGAVGGGVANHLNFVYSFYGILDEQTKSFEIRHIPLKINPFLELRKQKHSQKLLRNDTLDTDTVAEDKKRYWLNRLDMAGAVAPMGSFIEWASTYDKFDDVWFNCPRGDWLIWLALLFIESENFHHQAVKAIYACCDVVREYVEKGCVGPTIAAKLMNLWLDGTTSLGAIDDGITAIKVIADPTLYDEQRDSHDTLAVRHARSLACAAYGACLQAILIKERDFSTPVIVAIHMKNVASAIACCKVAFSKQKTERELPQDSVGLDEQKIKKQELKKFAGIIREIIPCPKIVKGFGS